MAGWGKCSKCKCDVPHLADWYKHIAAKSSGRLNQTGLFSRSTGSPCNLFNAHWLPDGMATDDMDDEEGGDGAEMEGESDSDRDGLPEDAFSPEKILELLHKEYGGHFPFRCDCNCILLRTPQRESLKK